MRLGLALQHSLSHIRITGSMANSDSSKESRPESPKLTSFFIRDLLTPKDSEKTEPESGNYGPEILCSEALQQSFLLRNPLKFDPRLLNWHGMNAANFLYGHLGHNGEQFQEKTVDKSKCRKCFQFD